MHEEPGFFAEPRNWVIIAFFLFFIIFGRKLWGALAGMLDARAASVRAEMDEAARLKSEAQAMLKEAEAARAKALTDAKSLIDGAAAEAARVAEAARTEAEASAKRREQMALDRIAAAQKQAVDEVRTAAAELATIAARQVIAEGLSPESSAALIDQAIAQLPAALATRRAA
ncbi:MAG TPA: F0F1 ATP synthase subunit B [Acetobacteraceae bacterium]|jgi:F-type H+-transporting ATPase subunit b|nr:F0F1 ATP synthase subunit B [Acetobacteraceae bacterium]